MSEVDEYGKEYMCLLTQVEKEKIKVMNGSRLDKLYFIYRGIKNHIYYSYIAYYFDHTEYKKYKKYCNLIDETNEKLKNIEPFLNHIRNNK